MEYKVFNVYTEEHKEFNKIEDAFIYLMDEIERLNKADKADFETSWTKEDFFLYKFNPEKWCWENMKLWKVV